MKDTCWTQPAVTGEGQADFVGIMQDDHLDNTEIDEKITNMMQNRWK
jgi:hypothetical protein